MDLWKIFINNIPVILTIIIFIIIIIIIIIVIIIIIIIIKIYNYQPILLFLQISKTILAHKIMLQKAQNKVLLNNHIVVPLPFTKCIGTHRKLIKHKVADLGQDFVCWDVALPSPQITSFPYQWLFRSLKLYNKFI